MSQRYKVTIAYDGSEYVGFQIQKNGKSVQEVLEKALNVMAKKSDMKIVASGRTDSGVHALGQVIHFDYPSFVEPIRMQKALNSLLPDSVRVRDVKTVSDLFHARYHTCEKTYIYKVSLGDYMMPFDRLYSVFHPYKVDVSAMNEALSSIVGTHDFTSFCSSKTDKENKVRTLTKACVTYDALTNQLQFELSGDGFLYNMVRIIVGTTLQIGDGLKSVDALQNALALKNRQAAGPTAPPQGLYLAHVSYKKEEEWYQTYEENKGLK